MLTIVLSSDSDSNDKDVVIHEPVTQFLEDVWSNANLNLSRVDLVDCVVDFELILYLLCFKYILRN